MEFSRPEYWMGNLSLLQGIFPTQGLNPGLPHCWRVLTSSSGSSWLKNRTRVSCIVDRFFTNWAIREAPTHKRPNYGGGNEDNGDLLQKVPCTHCCTQCPWPCSRPPPTHTSSGDSCSLTGKSGSVSCGVTAPFSWVLGCTRFCLCPPRVCFRSPVEGL